VSPQVFCEGNAQSRCAQRDCGALVVPGSRGWQYCSEARDAAPADAARRLRAALTLWRGPALANVRLEDPAAHPDAARVPPLVTRPFSFAECLHTPPMKARYKSEG
jgi:hypothetical protein